MRLAHARTRVSDSRRVAAGSDASLRLAFVPQLRGAGRIGLAWREHGPYESHSPENGCESAAIAGARSKRARPSNLPGGS